MFLRIIRDFFLRRKAGIAIAILAVVMGAAITSSLLTVSLNITEKVAIELKAFGANIVVTPNSTSIPIEMGGIIYGSIKEQEYINESELPKLKAIFWRNQVVAFAPFLYGLVQAESHTAKSQEVILTGTWFNKRFDVPASSITFPNGTILKRSGGSFTTGVKTLAPWWKVEGSWISDQDEGGSIVGVSIAKKLDLHVGDRLKIAYNAFTYDFTVRGILTTGSFEDDQIFVPLDVAQMILGKPNKVQKILVSALIKPDDELATRDHRKMTEEEHVRWYCSPYVGVFVYQIEEALSNVKAKPIRQIAETEGRLLQQTQVLFSLIAANAIGVSSLAVASTMTASVLQRRREIGLMKAIGADNIQVAAQLLAEAGILGLLGGVLGFPLGYLLARFISYNVFAAPMSDPLAFPITILVAVGISLAGSVVPMRKAMAMEPAIVLRGE